jgi:polysaccharide export outer membrane protein
MTVKFHSKSIASALPAAIVLVTLGANPCAAQAAQPANSKVTAPSPTAVSTPPAVVAAVPVAADYLIGAEDVLQIMFWRDKDMSAEVMVRPDGMISLPLLNEVHAAGLTPTQLKDLLIEQSKKFVEDPNITVVIKQINSRKVYITGEVGKPGLYPLMGPTTILQLISLAGGLRDYAKSDKITIMRNDGGKPANFRFNFQEVLKGKKLQQNILLKPGDTIIVP